MTIVDHVNLPVSDLERSRHFYEVTLEPLGYKFLMQDGRAMGFGTANWNFGIVETPPPFPSLHLAFIANSVEQVGRFFEAALGVGGMPNGAPGLRPHYHSGYYAAFVRDPDGHNIEAVFRSR
jgi:catechol 2,3-dioxygenase-like lactoylglutathione lyase family enzyme